MKTKFANSWFGLAALIAAGTLAAAPAAAQSWPTQRVTIVVPFGAGSVTDIMARILAEDLAKRWNQQVLVENRPGIAGTAGVAKAAPDGYTLLLTSNGHTVSNLVSKSAPFDAVKDFAGITRVCNVPLYLIFNPGTPAKNLKEVIALAKEKPGTLNFSSPGLASTTFIAGALFRKAAGINIVHVPFKSAPGRGHCGHSRRRAYVFCAGQSVEGAGRRRQGDRNRRSHRQAHPGYAEHSDLHRSRPAVRLRFLVRHAGASRRAARAHREDQSRRGRLDQEPRHRCQDAGAVRDPRHRHAGCVGQDHPRRDRKLDAGLQGGGASKRRRLQSACPWARGERRAPFFVSAGAARRGRSRA